MRQALHIQNKTILIQNTHFPNTRFFNSNLSTILKDTKIKKNPTKTKRRETSLERERERSEQGFLKVPTCFGISAILKKEMDPTHLRR